MTTCNVVKKLALGVALSGLFAWQAGATIAYNFPGNLQGSQPDGTYTLGNEFQVTTPITVTALGAFDPNRAAFNSAVDVAIYSITLSGTSISSISLATPVAIFSGSQSVFDGSTAIQAIAPVTLGVGTYMVVANNYGIAGAFQDYNQYWQQPPGASQVSPNTIPGVTFTSVGYWNTGSGWNYDPVGNSTPRYGAGNFVVVPEAGGFALAGVALLGLVYVGRCYRQKLQLA